MKKTLALVIIIYSHVSFLHACTTFFINNNGQMVFGRNYDWVTDAGIVCTNLKGLSKTSMLTENGETISWISQYGSITFNQYGKEFPTGGMNEKGLVVELMWLDAARRSEKLLLQINNFGYHLPVLLPFITWWQMQMVKQQLLNF
jgi:penicillin V acylase-like amidase (Ntn superfamily)